MNSLSKILIKAITIFVFCLIISFGFFSAYASCQITEVSIVLPFELNGHAILLDTKINDSPKIYKFAFDTGGKTTLNPRILKGLNIVPTKTYKVMHFDFINYNYTVDSIRVGPIKKENYKLYSLYSENKDYYDDMDGFIGRKYFQGYRFTIDYKNRIIILSDHKEPLHSGKDSILAKFSSFNFNGSFNIKLTINDSIEIEAMLDTGCPAALIMPKSYLDSLSGFHNQPIIKSRGTILEFVFGQPEECYLSRIPSLKIAGHEFKNIPVCFLGDWVYMGKDFLLPFKTTFDYQNNQILMVRHEGEQIRDNIISYGVQVSLKDDNRLFVKGLWEGSAADLAGITPGDEILEINGKKVIDYIGADIHEPFRNKQVDEIELLIKGKEINGRIILKKTALLPEI